MVYIHEDDRIYALDETGDLLVEATFPFTSEKEVVIDHVFVDPKLRGQGQASKLMQEVYDYLKKRQYKAVARCPYAVHWFARHTDKQDILLNQKEVNKSA